LLDFRLNAHPFRFVQFAMMEQTTAGAGRKLMARIPLRLLGLFLLALAIVIPGCQALMRGAPAPGAPAAVERGLDE
jgi:hypothetical protein